MTEELLRDLIAQKIHEKNDKCSGNPCECYEMADTVLKALMATPSPYGANMKDKLSFTEWKAQVLLYFREVPIAQAVETQQEVNGIVESRRVEEKFPEDK